ncbi:MAG: pyridoxamine kinase [Clostridia bacterium]|nr:pyridoxamine kinase [Clostridia bacterium]
MEYKRILSVQDISCVGQCSLTVALPIISSCGVETSILPSAVLSTHTAPGFGKFTFRDLTDDLDSIVSHWQEKDIKFDALYTGYLGNDKQVDIIIKIKETLLNKDALFICDPAMGDNGKLYAGFDTAFAKNMARLCSKADIILPNITEASFMLGCEYKEKYDVEYIQSIAKSLIEMGAKNVVLTGISFDDESTGVFTVVNGKENYFKHPKINIYRHGTGDVYSSAFTASLMNGKGIEDAAKIAALFTYKCIDISKDDLNHWYGVKFEQEIGYLRELIFGK